jgi:PAS domain S-box-containing protein
MDHPLTDTAETATKKPRDEIPEALPSSEERLRRLLLVNERLALAQDLQSTSKAVADGIAMLLNVPQVVLRHAVPDGLTTEVVTFAPGEHEQLVKHYHFIPADANHPAAEALRERRIVIIPNEEAFAQQYPEHYSAFQAVQLHSVLSLPLVHNGLVIAVASAGFREPQRFTSTDLTLMQTLAERCAAALERAQLFERLRRSEERYRQLANAMPQLVWTSDAQGVVDYYNSRAVEYAGLNQDEHGVWSWQPMLHADDLTPTLAAWEAAQQTATYEFEHRMQMSDGSYRWHLSRAYAVRNSDGSIGKWYGTATDIHERKQAEEDTLLLVDLGERIRKSDNVDGLLGDALRAIGQYLQVRRCYFAEVDQLQNIWFVEQEYLAAPPSLVGSYRLADYPPRQIEIVRNGQVDVCTDASIDPRLAHYYATAYAPIGVRSYIVVPLLREGQWVSNLIVDSDQPRKWEPREVWLLETVAERLWLAVERLRLEAQRKKAEAEVARLLVEEQAARKHAEAASRLKDEFLATVSHELRTPLTSLLGYLHLLQSRKRSEEESARLIGNIARSARAQTQLIEDLLDMSRIITGKLRINPALIDFAKVVEQSIDAVRPTLEAKSLRLETVLDPALGPLSGDPARLQQVVWNLLSNAVKFTPEQGSVRVELQQRDGQAQLLVSDTGQGISPDFLPYVFERFRQGDSSSSRSVGGLGLGLAIVRHLVEMHGGTVEAHSAGVGKGASFIVCLPARANVTIAIPNDQQGEAIQAPTKLHGLRVLIVDDQSDILDMLQDLFSQAGALVITSGSADEALERLETWPVDLLISDIAMPTRDGYWLIEQIRAHQREQISKLPAIALTAYVRTEDRARLLEAGFQLSIAKPVDADEMLALVASMVQQGAIPPLASADNAYAFSSSVAGSEQH